jgi:hypothetical protein
MTVGASSKLVMCIDFNALPTAVSWTMEEVAADADAADAHADADADVDAGADADAGADTGQGAPDAKPAEKSTRRTTHESDVLKRIDIYACT